MKSIYFKKEPSLIRKLLFVLVNAIFIMCAVIALSLQQWQNFGIAVFVLAVSCMILKLWDIIEYAIGVICDHLFEILSVLLEPGGIDHSESSRNNQSELIRNSQCTCLAN